MESGHAADGKALMPGRPTPRDFEVPVGFKELFFSRTDVKGHIKSGNSVFTRVSGYPLEVMLGQAHNIVRHPDMPRVVFKLLWEHLEAGQPIAAYVKNLAADGSYYWVMATAFPLPDGHLSIRLHPSSELFAAAREIYKELVRVEREVEAGEPRNRKPAIEASRSRLGELLAERGFGTYDDFMHAALPAEVAARQAALATAERTAADAAPTGDPGLEGMLGGCNEIAGDLTRLIANLERYAALSADLVRKSSFVLDLAESIRLFSLNAILAATRLGEQGAALSAVARIMRSRSDTTGPIIRALSSEIEGAVAALADLGYRIAGSTLRTEMAARFIAEVMRDGFGPETTEDLHALAHSLQLGVDRLLEALDALDVRLAAVLQHVAHLGRALEVMRALEVNGRVEAAKADGADAVRELFLTIGKQVGAARAELQDFGGVATIAAERDPTAEDRMRRQVHRICSQLDQLSVA
jgi:aerotaxis receptor